MMSILGKTNNLFIIMTRNILLILSIYFFQITLYAQESTTISDQSENLVEEIKDKYSIIGKVAYGNGAIVGDAEVTLLDTNEKLILTTRTSRKFLKRFGGGKFRFDEVLPDEYIINVDLGTRVGISKRIRLKDKDLNLGAGVSIAGDLYVSGDIVYDEAGARNINVTGVGTITRLNTTNLVGTISTITRLNWTDAVGTSATITQLNATDLVVSGLITATSFTGSAQVAISSEGDYMGAGASVLNFSSSTGQAIVVTPAGTSGIATIQVKPGASLGLAIALGG